MKTKIYILFILIMFACLPLEVQAVDHTFPAGSIIIPMDKFYQPEDVTPDSDLQDGGILETYGLVYYLLGHQDQTDLLKCDSEPVATQDTCKALASHDITVYWVIDQDKALIGDPDLIIQDDALPRTEGTETINEVVKLFNHAAGGAPTTLAFDTANGDSPDKITYRGGIWIIDINDLTRNDGDSTLDDLVAVENIIRDSNWSQVKVHVAQVSFTASVFRRMQGKPPRIALMNSEENSGKGNAKILESYLRLAGICPDNYDVLSPNEIGGVVAPGGDDSSKLLTGGYDFLWAPHWAGYDKYDGDVNANGDLDVEDIVLKIKQYLKSGGALLAECASIETFEYSENGRFLSDHGFAHNGGTNDPDYVVYNDVTAPYAQIGDFDEGFDPEGGHLHNWRPYQIGDDANKNFNFDVPPTEDASYNDTVTRYTVDDKDSDGVDDLDWDYYTGGYAFGKSYYGYVVYLGGHKYAKCDDDVALNEHIIKFEFKNDLSTEVLDFKIKFKKDDESDKDLELTVDLNKDIKLIKTGLVLEVDLTDAKVKDKKLEGVIFRNLSDADLTITKIELEWKPGDPWTTIHWADMTAADQTQWAILGWTEVMWENSFHLDNPDWPPSEYKYWNDLTDAERAACVLLGYTQESWDEVEPDLQRIKKIEDKSTDIKHLDEETEQKLQLDITQDFTIQEIVDPGDVIGCALQNSNCEWTNLAGVRYVLNTLFNIKYQKGSSMFVRAAPIVSHPYLYQGYYAFEPRVDDPWVDDDLVGHFRRFDMTQTVPPSGIPVYEWDTAVDPNLADPAPSPPKHPGIPYPGDGNSTGNRQVFTAEDDGSLNFSKLAFDFGSIEDLRIPLDLTPNTGAGEDDDEKLLINRVRGKRWNFTADTPDYVDDPNRLGAIMHSAPVIIRSGLKDSRFSGRPEVAYVGDLNGMLHAIKTETGEEMWAYIPSNLLGKLKNVRSDPAAVQDFAAVDGSPTAKDIYYDFDYDPDALNWVPENPSWHTILICTQGLGGKSVFALDVTDPNAWKVLWEVTVADPDPNTPGGAMGHAFRAALDKVKVRVPKKDSFGVDIFGQYEYKVEWRVYVATSFTKKLDEPGGINVFAFDLRTGEKKWTFSSIYADSQNDIPGAVTTFDLDGDTFADRVYVGDMNGRLWALDANDPDPDVSGDPDRSVYKNSTGDPIPLFNAGVGNPISVSPAITMHNGHVILIFGTGGTDWATTANSKQYAVYYVDATAAAKLNPSEINTNYGTVAAAHTALWTYWLPVGQKIWSSPTIAVGQIWIASSSGTMESDNDEVNNDLMGSGELRVLDMDLKSLLRDDTGTVIDHMDFKKVRGSLFVTHGHVYATAIDGSIIQLGDEDFTAGTGNRVLLRSWQHE